MSEIQIMKHEILVRYGRHSREAMYAQYIFSRRSTEYFISVYTKLMKGADRND